MYECKMLIDGKWVECFDVGIREDPVTGDILFIIKEVESKERHYLTEDELLEFVKYGN